jgi:hypothetical protein
MMESEKEFSGLVEFEKGEAAEKISRNFSCCLSSAALSLHE